MSPAGLPVVRAMREADLAAADRVFRLAFGTFLGLPDPSSFAGDADYVRSRFAAFPDRAFVAERDAEVVGSIFVARWGSFAFLGPVTTRPDCWDQGVGKRLLEPVLEQFAAWRVSLAGLYTFAQSPKHVGLYSKYGFWPRALTALMARPVSKASGDGVLRFSRLSERERADWIGACAELTGRIYAGLDVDDEIGAVQRLGLGDTLIVPGKSGVDAFAVCHWGRGLEGGSGTLYVKFGAARAGPGAEGRLERLLAACNGVARDEGLAVVLAGVNAAREGAWRTMTRAGFRGVLQGVAMLRDNAEGYNRPDAFVLDDWR
jgi:predicted N-acetyltransferase YhbS